MGIRQGKRQAAGMAVAVLLAVPAAGADRPSSPPSPSPTSPVLAGARMNAAGARFVGGQLVEAAREVLANGALPPDVAAQEAALLLGWAQKVEEGAGVMDAGTLRMLVEAARTAGKATLQRESLRKLISTDREDVVAQVSYLDLLAAGAQTVEERARLYTSALEQANLSSQVRSEMALRLSQLALERGDSEAEKQWLGRAVSLNSVNVGALRGQVRVAAANPRAVPEQMTALVALVSADPFQPEAWLRMSSLCRGANLHDRAADYLGVALEQMQLAGGGGGGDLYLDYALEMAIGGRRRDAAGLLGSLASLPDAPLSAMLAAQLLSDAGAPAAAPSTTAPAATPLAERIEKALQEMARDAAAGRRPQAAWADAAGVVLTVLAPGAGSTVMAQGAEWIDAYAKQAPADDVTLARLRGWQHFRAGQLEEARATLEKVADEDPMSAIGLARVYIAQQKVAEATRLLQGVWSEHPTGLLALQTVETARAGGGGGIKLEETQWSRQLGQIAARIPPAVMIAHRQPRDLQLLSATIDRHMVGPGEPVMLVARITNTTSRPIPASVARLGAEGTLATAFGLWAQQRGEQKALGLYAVEDGGRVFRVEPYGAVETKFRVDQGKVAALFGNNPFEAATATVRVITAPVVKGDGEVVPGLGGQVAAVGDITRRAIPLKSAADFEAFQKQLATGEANEQTLGHVLAAGKLLQMAASGTVAAELGAADEVRRKLVESLIPLAGSNDPAMRSTLLMGMPATVQEPELEKSLAGMATDGDPVVRAMWARRAAGPPGGQRPDPAVVERLRQLASTERDPAVKEWMELLAARPAATRPAATQPR